jgi:hypothetical protein
MAMALILAGVGAAAAAPAADLSRALLPLPLVDRDADAVVEISGAVPVETPVQLEAYDREGVWLGRETVRVEGGQTVSLSVGEFPSGTALLAAELPEGVALHALYRNRGGREKVAALSRAAADFLIPLPREASLAQGTLILANPGPGEARPELRLLDERGVTLAAVDLPPIPGSGTGEHRTADLLDAATLARGAALRITSDGDLAAILFLAPAEGDLWAIPAPAPAAATLLLPAGPLGAFGGAPDFLVANPGAAECLVSPAALLTDGSTRDLVPFSVPAGGTLRVGGAGLPSGTVALALSSGCGPAAHLAAVARDGRGRAVLPAVPLEEWQRGIRLATDLEGTWLQVLPVAAEEGEGRRGAAPLHPSDFIRMPAAVVNACGIIAANTTWTAGNVYVLNACTLTVNAGATLTVQAGTVVKLGYSGGYYGRIYVYGGLVSQGSAGAPVTFTSYQDDSVGGDTNGNGGATTAAKGDWQFIQFQAGTSGSFTYTNLGYGGGASNGLVNVYDQGTVSMDHVSISQSASHGLWTQNATVPFTSGSASHNTWGGLCYDGLDPSRNLSVTGNTFTGNGTRAGYLNFRSANPPVLDFRNNSTSGNGLNGFEVWGTVASSLSWDNTGGVPLTLVGNTLTVGEGAILTLSPGTNVKLGNTGGYYGRFYVYGELRAVGTAVSPISFTSTKDDAHGGDTDGAGGAAAKGDWQFVQFQAGTRGTFSHVFFGYGGASSNGMVNVYDGADVDMDHVTLASSASHGLWTLNATVPFTLGAATGNTWGGLCYDGLETSRNLTVSGSSFTGNGNRAGYVNFRSANPASLDFRGNTASGNGLSAFEVWGTIASSLSWDNRGGIPLSLVGNTLNVGAGATLTLSQGTVVKLGYTGGYYGRIYVYGGLQAVGTAEAPLAFTSTKDDLHGGNSDGDGGAPGKGEWQHIQFQAGTSGRFSHVFIGHGGGASTAMVNVYDGADVDMDHVTLASSASYGLWTQHATANLLGGTVRDNAYAGLYYQGLETSRSLTVSDVAFSGNGYAAAYLNFRNANPARVSLLRNTADGNKYDSVEVWGDIAADLTLDTTGGIPLSLVGSTLSVGAAATLTLTPGTVTKLGYTGGYYGRIYVYGGLSAVGTAEAPLAFTSIKDDLHGGDTDNSAALPSKGEWQFLQFQPGTRGEIAHAYFGYGGGASNAMVNVYDGADVDLDHCTVASSATYGLWTQHATANFTDGDARDNAWAGLYFQGLETGRDLSVAGTSFSGNGYAAAYLNFRNANPPRVDLSGTTADGNRYDSVEVWGDIAADLTLDTTGGIPLSLVGSSLSVGAAATLTLTPGTVTKLGYTGGYYGRIYVYGGLSAVGTAESPMAFTSIKDDLHGGDTDNDSGANAPAKGDWQFLQFQPNTRGEFSHAFFGYGGGASAAMINIYNGAQVTFDGGTVTQAPAGIYAQNAGPFLRGTGIHGNGTGIYTNSGNGNLWVDARACWWGHASGPFHGTRNPAGQGNPVGDRVIFAPWAADEAGTVTQPVALDVLGPGRASPGQTVDYYVAYYTSQPLDDAVLVVTLPATTIYGGSLPEGIYHFRGNQVFWRLGDLGAAGEGMVQVTLTYLWGLPDNLDDGFSAILGSRSQDFGSYSFALQEYLDYAADASRTFASLSDAAIDAELAAHPALKAAYDAAILEGFTRLGGFSLTYGPDAFSILVLGNRSGAFLELRRNRLDDRVLTTGISAADYRLAGEGGSLTMGMEDDLVTIDEGAGMSLFGPAAVLKPSEWVALRNCLLQEAGKWALKKVSTVLKVTFGAYDCYKALMYGDPSAAGGCMNQLKKVKDTVPIFSEIKSVHKCWWDCIIGKQVDKYTCSGNLLKVEPPEFSLTNMWTWTEASRNRAYVSYRCNPTTEMWEKPEYLLCPRGYVAMEGVRDDQGRPCAPANDLVAFAYGEEDRKLPARNVKTAVRRARDPNEKRGVEGNVLPGQEITYVIDYENVGAGQAYGVFILDQLSPAFDETTLTVNDGGVWSAPARLLSWSVGDLAPKGSAGSKGAVGFTVRLRDDLPEGTVVNNQATVFFPSVPEETPTTQVVNMVRTVVALPGTAATTQGLAVGVTLQGTEASGLPLTYQVTETPLYGTLSGTPPALTYTPGDWFVGTDRFLFTVANGGRVSEAAEVTVEVGPSPDDDTPPAVTAVFPEDGAELAADNGLAYADSRGTVYPPTLMVQFAESLDPASVGSGSLSLKSPGGATVTTDLTYDAANRRLLLLVRQPWSWGTHTLTLAAGLRDLAGNATDGEETWRFTATPPPGTLVTITATAGAHGRITPSGPVEVPFGEDREFQIVADPGYRILDVQVDGVSVGAVAGYTFRDVTAPHTIAASFAPLVFTITAGAGPNGTITPSGPVSVSWDADQSFQITPVAGYRVADVLVDGASAGPVLAYTFSDVRADHAIQASFTPFLSNASFETGTKVPTGWTAKKLGKTDGRVKPGKAGSYSVKLAGTTATKTLTQRVAWTLPAESKLSLTGWSKAQSPNPRGGNYALQVKLLYAGGSSKVFTKSFTKKTHAWQKVTLALTAAQEVTAVEATVTYARQKGTAWFDDLSLTFLPGSGLEMSDPKLASGTE